MLITFPFNTNTRLLFAASVLLLFTRLNGFLRPYKEETFNSLEIMSYNSGIIILISGLIYSQDEEVSVLNLIFMIIALVVNAYFVLSWAYQLLNLYKSQSKFVKAVSEV